MAELQSGRVNTAVTTVIGRDMGASMDKIAQAKLEAFTTTLIYPNAASSAATLGAGDVLDRTFAGRLYNKLARLNVPGVIGGMYGGIAHEDQLFDLRNDAGSGNWVSVNQYSNLTPILQNEIGMFEGIRWFRSKNVTVTANSSGTLDSYKVCVLGLNALGKAVTKEPGIVISGPFDSLQRFYNVGWYGIFGYAVVDTANMVQGITTSSVTG
jgi:N4-gp56 family major capsid protein